MKTHDPVIPIMNSCRVPFLAFVILVLSSTLHYAEAIVCYQCNSEHDPRCGNPFDPYSLGTVNCSFQPRLEHLSHLEPTLCRKISQKVYGKERVVRGCGYITDEKDNGDCLMRAGTHDVRALYCSCTGDLCNTAGALQPSLLPFVLSSLAILVAAASLSRQLAVPVSPSFSVA